MKKLSIALAIAGLMLGTLLVGWYGFAPVAKAMLSVGWAGFAGYCLWQLATMFVLGIAWRAVAPIGGGLRLAPFVWGRSVRDSAAVCLPFSMVGGFVLGVRAAALEGVAWSVAALSLVVDLTAEFLAEIAFAVAAIAEMLARAANPSLTTPFVVALAVMLMAGAAMLRWWKGAPPLFTRLGRRIGQRLDRFVKFDAPAEPDAASLYGDSGRMALGTAIHFLGWLCKGYGNWIAFRLLGWPIDVVAALVIEALLHALLIPAIVIPGYAGVQEAGYAAIGALFGIPPDLSLAVSLLRRARDVAIGVPVLLAWQFVEVRRLRRPEGQPESAAAMRPGDG